MSVTQLKRTAVVDEHLSAIAQGFATPEMIGTRILTQVVTAKTSGKFIKWDRDAYKIYNSDRALGENRRRVNFSHTLGSYAFGLGDSLSVAIDDREEEEAMGVPMLDLQEQKMQALLTTFEIKKEKSIADIVTNASNYGNTQAASAAWGTVTTNIKKDVSDAQVKLRKKIGRKGNILVVSAPIFDAMCYNEKILDVYKHTSPGYLTEELLAKALGVDEVIVGQATYTDDAGTTTEIWGTGFAAVLYRGKPISTNVPNPYDLPPSYGWNLQKFGYRKTLIYRNEDGSSDIIAVDDNWLPLLTSSDSGCIITGV